MKLSIIIPAFNEEKLLPEHGVNAIPAVIVPATGRRLVGLAEAAAYRAIIEEAEAR